jgi:hypothetical protein
MNYPYIHASGYVRVNLQGNSYGVAVVVGDVCVTVA